MEENYKCVIIVTTNIYPQSESKTCNQIGYTNIFLVNNLAQ